MTSALEQIAALVQRESGIVVFGPQLESLRATLARVGAGRDAHESLRELSDPAAGRARLAHLIDELTVKETYFLRHPEQLGAIPWDTLLRRARASGRATVRAWSAGCATGEEAYSLALLACEAFGTLEPPVEVLGSDISASALAAAAAGRYRPRSTRTLSASRQRLHTSPAGDVRSVAPHLRALVRFARHNLALDPAPPSGWTRFELILCRNVLIYFDAGTIERVLSALEGALAPGGMLILGAADALCCHPTRMRAAGPPPRPRGDEPSSRADERHSSADERHWRADERHSRPRSQAHGRRAPAEPSAQRAPAERSPSPTAEFLRGLAELEASNPLAAAAAFRRTLYADPGFGLAAFQLGRCYESLGDAQAAGRAYRQALRALAGESSAHEQLLEQVSLDDIVAAATARLATLGSAPQPAGGDNR